MSVFQGFFELIPQDLIKIFDENELEVSLLSCVSLQIYLRKMNKDFISVPSFSS